MELDRTQPPFHGYPNREWGNEVITATRERPWCPDCGPLNLNEDGQIISHHCPTYSNLPSIDGFLHAQEANLLCSEWGTFLHEWTEHIAELHTRHDAALKNYNEGLITTDELNALVDLPTPTIQYRPEGATND